MAASIAFNKDEHDRREQKNRNMRDAGLQ